MYLILGRQNCRYCDKAKELLESKGVPYIYKDITSGDCIADAHWKNFLVEDMKAKTLPQIFVMIGGYADLVEVTWYD